MYFNITHDYLKWQYNLPQEVIKEVYLQVEKQFFLNHQLPTVHLWDTGFYEGSASEEELEALAVQLGVERDDLLTKLDEMFLEVFHQALSKKEGSSDG